MKWIIRTLALIVLAIAGVAVIGWVLPVHHVASRRAVYAQPIEHVFAAVEAEYRDEQARSDIRMEVAELQPPQRMVTRIVDSDQPFGGTWTFELTTEETGTRVTITERGEIHNAIFRFMARYVFGYTATMESFLAALGRRLGDDPATTAQTVP
jgi:hypothetical protein